MSTGYQDRDLISNNAENSKGMFAVHFRPNEKTEVSLTSLNQGLDSPLQGFGRYSMKNIQIEQHKLQIDSGRLNFRTYYTRQDGDSYQLSAAGSLLANSPNSNQVDLSALGLGSFNGYYGWFVNYNLTYMGALAMGSRFNTRYFRGILGFVQNVVAPHIMTGGTDINQLFSSVGGTGAAHNLARAAANQGMLQPGTAAFETEFNAVTSRNLPVVQAAGGGAGIFDDTKTYNYELNYDLSGLTGNVDFLVGGSMRKTELNSKGTIYSDQDGPIEYSETGAYVQGVTNILNDKVSLTGSLRVDKHEFFDANYTPRIAALYNVNWKTKILEIGYQPDWKPNQSGSVHRSFLLENVTLLGSSPDNISRYNGAVVLDNGSPFQFTGDFVFNNSYNQDGTASNLKHVTAEKITSVFHVGYRFKKPGFTFDISAYLSNYDNKI